MVTRARQRDDSSSEPDSEKQYDVRQILAQRINPKGEKVYLVYWLGYPIERATWEPRESFDHPGKLKEWKRERREQRAGLAVPFDVEGLERRQAERKSRIAARREQRAKNEKEEESAQSSVKYPLKQSNSLVGFIAPDSDSEDDIPLAQAALNRQKQKQQQGDVQPLFSDSDEDSGNVTDDSMMEELAKRTPASKTKAVSSHKKKEAVDQSLEKTMPTKLPQPDSSHLQAAPKDLHRSDKPASNTHNKTPPVKPKLTVHTGTRKAQPIVEQSLGGLSGTARPTHEGKDNSGIFKNWADSSKRKPRKQSGPTDDKDPQLFGNLSMKHRFQKFGQLDRVPSIASLPRDRSYDSLFIDPNDDSDGVHGTLPMQPTPTTNPALPLPRTVDTDKPLHGSEPDNTSSERTNRIPLTCWKWYANGERCPNDPCHLMHQEGFPLSDPSGYLPPKYFKTPQTCWHWFNTKCKHDEATCNFAHWNTGLIAPLPGGRSNREPRQVDSSDLPMSQRPHCPHVDFGEGAAPEPVETEYPGKHDVGKPGLLTCYYWWHETCGTTECPHGHAHFSTGLIAPGKLNPMKEADGPPANKKALTCPYWSNHKCKHCAPKCQFAHYFTGWVFVEGGPPKRLIPPAKTLTLVKSSKDLQCFYWYKWGRCTKSDEDCEYAHEKRDTVSDVPRSISGYPKGMTCYYWFDRHCKRSLEECSFAHELKDVIAVPHRMLQTLQQKINDHNLLSTSKDLDSAPDTCMDLGPSPSSPHNASTPLNPSLTSTKALPPPPPSALNAPTKSNTSITSAEALPQPPPSALNSSTGRALFPARIEALPPPALHTTPNPALDLIPTSLHSGAESIPPRPPPHVSAQLGLDVTLTTDDAQIDVSFEGLDAASRAKFVELTGPKISFAIDKFCLREDFHNFVLDERTTRFLAGGTVAAKSQSSAEWNKFSQFLISHGYYAGAEHRAFTLILHPEKMGTPEPSDIKFRIYSGIEIPPTPYRSEDEASWHAQRKKAETPLETLFRSQYGITIEFLFDAIIRKSRGFPEKYRNVFIIMDPEEYADELNLWTMFFQESDVKVFTHLIAGSWDYFRKNSERGIILVQYRLFVFDEIHEFRQILAEEEHDIFWAYPLVPLPPTSVEIEYTEYVEPLPPRKVSMLYPFGTFFCITDDIFIHHPEQAYKLLKAFDDGLKKNRLLKVCTRAGVREWLIDLVADPKSTAKCVEIWLHCIRLIEKCTPPDEPWKHIDWAFMHPSQFSPLVSEHPEHWPNYPALYEESESKAADYLVEYFGGLCSIEEYIMEDWRRFVVVYPIRRNEWKEKYQQIQVVTPDECLENYLLKPDPVYDY